MGHSEEIIDQFTRQAAGFAQSQTARNQDILNQVIRLAEPRKTDAMLDVACGPGVLVCGFAPQVRHAAGIDLTPAMLDQARSLQSSEGLENISWVQGDVTPLPFLESSFDIVACRFAFHHFLDPLAVLREMRRVCRSGARLIVVDSAPAATRAEAFNAMEKLRDPSHTRALPVEELSTLFRAAGLPKPRIESFRLGQDLNSILARSYPREGDGLRIRAMFADALNEDFMDVQPRRDGENILFSMPGVAMVARVAEG
jgi:ubiquinone/menaquinone biosynthesis C-methylase UbiE